MGTESGGLNIFRMIILTIQNDPQNYFLNIKQLKLVTMIGPFTTYVQIDILIRNLLKTNYQFCDRKFLAILNFTKPLK